MYFHVFASYSDSLLLGFCFTNIIILCAKKGEKVPKFSLFPLSATCEALRFINVHEHASIEVCRCLWNYDQCTVALFGYLDDRMLEFFFKREGIFSESYPELSFLCLLQIYSNPLQNNPAYSVVK